MLAGSVAPDSRPSDPAVQKINDLKFSSQAAAMLADMRPVLKKGIYFLCSTDDPSLLTALMHCSLTVFQEDEGVALILEKNVARQHGFALAMPMCRIVLELLPALDGVGLTAGVANSLADDGIPRNVIPAYHHYNVFVPASMGHRAIGIFESV